MEYYLVDKFNRGAFNQNQGVTVVERERETGDSNSITLTGNSWNAKKRKIVNVERGSMAGEVTTVDQTLINVGGGAQFEHNKQKYTLFSNNADLDLNNHRIKNLADAVDEGDAICARQLVQYLNDIRNRLRVIEEIGNQYSITKTYFSAKSRRIVNVRPGLDKNDVIIRSQLDPISKKLDKVEKHLDDLLKGIDVTKDCLKIKDQRRVCNVGKGIETHDVVTHVQLNELKEQMILFQTAVNQKFTQVQTMITSKNE